MVIHVTRRRSPKNGIRCGVIFTLQVLQRLPSVRLVVGDDGVGRIPDVSEPMAASGRSPASFALESLAEPFLAFFAVSCGVGSIRSGTKPDTGNGLPFDRRFLAQQVHVVAERGQLPVQRAHFCAERCLARGRHV